MPSKIIENKYFFNLVNVKVTSEISCVMYGTNENYEPTNYSKTIKFAGVKVYENISTTSGNHTTAKSSIGFKG